MSKAKKLSYRLSPNEEAAVLRSQREEKRKARIVQVREQEREAARRVRETERQRREKENKLLQDDIQSHLMACHTAELAAVEERYTAASRHIGLAHRQAEQVEREESRLCELRLLLAAKQRERAKDRHLLAVKEELSRQQQSQRERKRKTERVRLTREEEGKRARGMASQSVGQPPLIMDLVAGRGTRKVRLQEVEGYSSSYYHIPSCTVQRAGSVEREGPDAQQMADLMTEEMDNLDKHSSAVHEEQREMARLRYIHALSKVRMEKEREELEEQLRILEREDRAVRQKALSSMPAQLYQPVEGQRSEVREQQRDMEQAFERIFVSSQAKHPTILEDPPSSPSNDNLLEQSTAIVSDGAEPHISVPVASPSVELSISDLSASKLSSHSQLLPTDSTDQHPQGPGSPPQGPGSPPQGPTAGSGSGVRKLVSMVRAQQEAWSQRVSARTAPVTLSEDSPEPVSLSGTLSGGDDSTLTPTDIPSDPPSLPDYYPEQPQNLCRVPLADLPRPNLSLSTANSDLTALASQINSPASDDPSLETTPTYTTLNLPEGTEADPAIPAETTNSGSEMASCDMVSPLQPSLQEAFLKRNVSESQRRLDQLGSRETSSPQSVGEKENRRRVVTFSSPLLYQSSLTRLPEVGRKKLEQKRSATYDSNRQRAKLYQQKVPAKFQKTLKN